MEWKRDKLIHIEHLFCKEDDRWILIERYEGGSVGLNFSQGDDYEYFKGYNTDINESLSKFYALMYRDFYRGGSEIEFINKIMWLYHETQQIWE